MTITDAIPMGTMPPSPPQASPSPVLTPSVSRRRPEPVGREARGLKRADALIASGQTDKALSHLQRLSRILPESPRIPLRIAALLREMRRPAEALEALRNAIERFPRALGPREALAEMCLEIGRWEEAIHQCLALLALTPRSLFARDVLSAAYLQRGLIEKALHVTEEMIALDPNDAAHHFKRGVLLQQKGKVAGALRAFQRVLQMQSDRETAEEAQAAIEMLDNLQLRQIVTLAVEDIPFRISLRDDAAATITARGYYLSERGLATLTQLRIEDAATPPGWRQYRYQ